MLLPVAQYKNKRIPGFVSPEALKVTEDGRVIEKSLQRELMTHEDLVERLRAKGIGSIEEVRVA